MIYSNRNKHIIEKTKEGYDMKHLCLLNNEFNLYELLYIFKEMGIQSCDVIINMDYVKQEGRKRLYDLLQGNQVFHLVEQDSRKIENRYGLVFVSSNITGYITDMLEKIRFDQLILLEDGTYDYMDRIHEDVWTNGSIKYVFNKKLVKHQGCMELREIKIDKSVDLGIVFARQLRKINELKESGIKSILFTTPLKEDFGFDKRSEVCNFMDEQYAGKMIGIKRHPRDFSTYEMHKCNTIDIETEILGQLIVNEFDCRQYYMFPSTTLLQTEDLRKVSIFLFDGPSEYKSSFHAANIMNADVLEYKL